MKRRWAILALALPLLVYLLAVVMAERHIAIGETYRFAIEGYDPRDLLRGRYLRFQVDYDWANERGSCSPEAISPHEECCYCLTKTDSLIPKVSHTTCEKARTQCDGVLRQTSADDLNRFYIPEQKAKVAEGLMRKAATEGHAHILVSITQDGEAQIIDLQIDGNPLNELLPTN